MERRDKETIIKEKVKELRKVRKPFTRSKTLGLNSALGMLMLLGVPVPLWASLGLVGANILLRSVSTTQGIK
jgi:uncharacterized membrane protein